MFNPSIRERIRSLTEQLRLLRSLQSVEEEEFLKNPLVSSTVERAFHLAIEALLDVGHFIIRREGWPTPLTYADIFRTLSRKGVLPSVKEEELVKLAQFRNLLVHGYAVIDKRRVYQLLQTRLDDLHEIARRITEWAEKINK